MNANKKLKFYSERVENIEGKMQSSSGLLKIEIKC